tara:strand:- start:4857 stop:5414 length:558 start_codon:yes stop_codon:yes gene_type:complete
MAEATYTDRDLTDRIRKKAMSMEAPIPGQSLTSDPDNPAPYERPPEFTTKQDALESLFVTLTQEKAYASLLNSLQSGISIMDIVKIILMQGFEEGKWNPDMILILAEPLAYMIMALAERADVEFIIQEEDPDDDDYDPDEDEYFKGESRRLPLLNKSLKKVTPPKRQPMPEEIREQMPQSLMAKE